jgi:hypothetical protein
MIYITVTNDGIPLIDEIKIDDSEGLI